MDLLVHKAHLIDGDSMPDLFVRFNTNSIVWGLYAATTQDGVIPPELAEDHRVLYPYEFDNHIVETTERINARVEALHKKYAQPLI